MSTPSATCIGLSIWNLTLFLCLSARIAKKEEMLAMQEEERHEEEKRRRKGERERAVARGYWSRFCGRLSHEPDLHEFGCLVTLTLTHSPISSTQQHINLVLVFLHLLNPDRNAERRHFLLLFFFFNIIHIQTSLLTTILIYKIPTYTQTGPTLLVLIATSHNNRSHYISCIA